jgi:hypothetical protein
MTPELRTLAASVIRDNLSDDDHVRSLDSDRWYTVRELRALATNPYAEGLATLRAANVVDTPEARFEQRYKDERLKALEAERADVVAHGDARFTTLDDSDLKQYTPPNPYQLALDALKAQR